LHAQAGQFNLDLYDTLENVGIRSRTGSFALKGIRALMHRVSFSRPQAGSFTLTGGDSTGTIIEKGIVDYVLDAEPALFSLNGGESKGKYREGGCVRNPTEWDTHKPKNTEWDIHNVRETWWDTHKLRCLHPEPATFVLTGMDVAFDDYTHFPLEAGAFFVNEEAEVEWDNNTTIWQEDDGVDTEWWDNANNYTNFHLTKYSGEGKFLLKGEDVSKNKGYALKAGAGSFTLTGNEVELINTIPYRLTPATGVFTLTGNNASGYVGGYADPGEFKVSGQEIGSQRDRLLKAQPRAFTLTGMSSESTLQKIFYVGSTSYTLTGMDAHAKVKGGSGAGEFNLEGQDASIRRTVTNLTAESGEFIVDGVNSGISYKISIEPATFIVDVNTAGRDEDSIFNSGSFTVDTIEVGSTRTYTTLADTGEFTVDTSDVGRIAHLPATAGDFTVTVADAGMRPSTYFKAGEFVFEGQHATAKWGERDKARTGSFRLYGKPVGSTRSYVFKAEAGEFFVLGNYVVSDNHELWAVGTGEFLVEAPCNKYTDLKAEAGEFLLEGVRAVFNSETTHLDAGPNAEFRIELQEVKAYGNFKPNTHTTFKVEGSDIQVGCGTISYTRWDAGLSRWDLGSTLWDKVKGPDIPCPIEDNTAEAGRFLVGMPAGVSGYLEVNGNNIDLNKLYAETGEFRVVHPNSDRSLYSETGEFRIELQKSSYYTSVDMGITEQTFWLEDVTDILTLWDRIYEPEEALWDVEENSDVFTVDMIEVKATVTRADGTIEYPDGVKDPSKHGVFNLSGGDVWFDHNIAPPLKSNVVLLAEYREFKLSDTCANRETFWDQYDNTVWYDEGYGEALWTEHYQDTRIVQWDADEARTFWDNDKSRWDRNKKCTSLDVDYVMKSNCK